MNKLWVRMSLAFLLVVWVSLAVVAFIVRSATESSFRQYINRRDTAIFEPQVLDRLQEHYAENGTWLGADSLLPGPQNASGNGNGQGQGQGRGGRGEGRGSVMLITNPDGEVVVATDASLVGTTLTPSTLERASALVVNGEQVGWLAQQSPTTEALGAAETAFLEDTNRRLSLAAVGSGLLAVVTGAALAWQLTRPLRSLRAAAHQLADGSLGHQVRIDGTAEIAALAHAFNRMSNDLARGETIRQRMAADIAHELRTPVSVLRGHLEAMLDGVYPLDGEHLAVAYDQTIHLGRLVDDLRLLTRAEAGQLPLELKLVSPGDIARRALDNFTPLALDAQITITHEIPDGLPMIRVDLDRIQQVLGNLMTNALRHTPPEGQIALRITVHNNAVRFEVCNTGRGLLPEQAANVFTPFWRAEEARDRDQGGSGLGLAISRQLVALHQGRVWVESVAGHHTSFFVEVPAVPA